MKKLVTLAAVAALNLAPAAFAQDAAAVYAKACQVCHAAGIANAPKKGDAAAWAPRLEKGLDALVASVKAGKGAMPPKGMCMDCTDEDFKNTIKFMSGAK